MLKTLKVGDEGDDVLIARPREVGQRDREEQMDVGEGGGPRKRHVRCGGVHWRSWGFPDVKDNTPKL